MSAVDTFGQQVHPELLLQLINSETVIFDILTDFFYHPNHAVASAALEVYIRRSYTAYELTGVHHFQLSCGSSFFTFRFLLPNEFVSKPLGRSIPYDGAYFGPAPPDTLKVMLLRNLFQLSSIVVSSLSRLETCR
ncbi:unnamed protein product [Schistosoma mattheei]|uniref:Acetyl-CoA carboxylase central domain-containing protein n=1 Tax=Schistosoma mattheei TaxID=31246 RepID=A0A3P8FQH1_9TREM|nr:unnamed protein product [Schistosoma mattheei]